MIFEGLLSGNVFRHSLANVSYQYFKILSFESSVYMYIGKASRWAYNKIHKIWASGVIT